MSEYVNLFGDPVDFSKHKPVKKKRSKEYAPTHCGWVIKGASPDIYAQKVSERNRAITSAKKHNAVPAVKTKLTVPEPLPPFYEWAKKNKNCKAHAKPFSTREAAMQCRKIAESNGWLHIEMTELSEGDVSQIKEGFIWR